MQSNTFFALLLAVLLGSWGCQSNSAPENTSAQPAVQAPTTPAPAAKKNILFFGNSLTAAYQLSPEQGFTAILQRRIDSLGLGYTCLNAGLSGETTADGVQRVAWVLRQPVDVFVLELGGNDALRGLPVEESRKNLQAIFEQVRAKYPQCRLVMAGMQAPPNLGNTYTSAFRKMYPDIAKANNAALIPFLLEGVGGVPSLNLPDGIHPNPAGQRIVADNVWAVLQTVL